MRKGSRAVISVFVHALLGIIVATLALGGCVHHGYTYARFRPIAEKLTAQGKKVRVGTYVRKAGIFPAVPQALTPGQPAPEPKPLEFELIKFKHINWGDEVYDGGKVNISIRDYSYALYASSLPFLLGGFVCATVIVFHDNPDAGGIPWWAWAGAATGAAAGGGLVALGVWLDPFWSDDGVIVPGPKEKKSRSVGLKAAFRF